MVDVKHCRYCASVATGRPIPVRQWLNVLEEWHLCHRCFAFLEAGFLTEHDAATFNAYVDGRGLQLTSAQVHTVVIEGLVLTKERDRRR